MVGTTVLLRHVLYMESVFGVYLENVKLTNCNNDEGYYETPTKINSILLTDSTLTVEFDFMSNCCHDFLCYLNVEDDEILKLDFIDYGADCACACPFKLKYLIHKVNESDFSKLKYVMIGNERDTMVELKNHNISIK